MGLERNNQQRKMKLPSTITTWYAIGAIGLPILFIIYSSLYSALQWLALLATNAFLRHVVYSTIGVFKLFKQQPMLIDVILASAFIGANAVCLGVGTGTTQELSSRCASILATNIILLLPGASVAADKLRISLRSYQKAHQVIGIVALSEGILHAVIELTGKDWKTDTISISGVAVSL
jgi:hypothetical protein